MNYKELDAEIHLLGNPDIAEHSARFFKTGKGEYGAGDFFLGVRVPVLRQRVKFARVLPLKDVLKFLHSKWHEKRLFALFVLVDRYQRADETEKREVFESYLANTQWINSWDLVDSSSHKIVGPWLADKDRSLLYQLVDSQSLWERRIAIISTYHFIRQGDLTDTFALSEILLNDEQDLIHKAVGWMLREAGKQDKLAESRFLIQHYDILPRTLLRYAIEKYPAAERQAWLLGDLNAIDLSR